MDTNGRKLIPQAGGKKEKAPVLALLICQKKYIVECDASGSRVWNVCIQEKHFSYSCISPLGARDPQFGDYKCQKECKRSLQKKQPVKQEESFLG